MIIVSQDKTEIVNFDNITKIAEKDGKIGISSKAFDSNYEEIGKYKTEERAKEVLQEIIEEYKKYVQIESIKEGTLNIAMIPKVYEMPKE